MIESNLSDQTISNMIWPYHIWSYITRPDRIWVDMTLLDKIWPDKIRYNQIKSDIYYHIWSGTSDHSMDVIICDLIRYDNLWFDMIRSKHIIRSDQIGWDQILSEAMSSDKIEYHH